MYDFMIALLVLLLMVSAFLVYQRAIWVSAIEVPMQVEICVPASRKVDGEQMTITVSCTGRIRYDGAGRMHIIGGIEAAEEDERR